MAQSPLITFSPVSAPRAFEHICDQIRMLLTSGALKPGDKLPPERELSAHLGVSRSVLREALRSLEMAGLVDLKKGGSGGSFIAAHNSRFVNQAFADLTRVGTITLSELTEARVLIMADAIRLGCERATEEDYQALEANIRQVEELTEREDYPGRRMVATDFYRLVALSAKNQVLVISVEAMTATLREFLRPRPNRPFTPVLESRRRFMKHFRARDAGKASSEMTAYLVGLQQYMVATSSRPAAAKPRPVAAKRARSTAKA